MKLVKMKYKTMKGEIKTNGYTFHISNKVVKESGIDDTKDLKVEVRGNEIVIKENK